MGDRDTVSRFLQLKKKADRARSEYQSLLGRKERVMEDLRERFGCATLEEAEQKLAELRKTISELEEDLDEQLARFEKRIARLQGNGD